MIERLPPHSHFRRAVADNDDLHRDVVGGTGDELAARRGPTLKDWSSDDELRAVLTDGFHLVQQAIGASVTPKGKPPPKFSPARRPQTAADRARRREQLQVHSEIVAMMLPRG